MKNFDKICEVLLLLSGTAFVILAFGSAAKIWVEVFK